MDLVQIREEFFNKFGKNNEDLKKLGFLWQDIDQEKNKSMDFRNIKDEYEQKTQRIKKNFKEETL